jgi:hypothetical protein
VWPFRRRERGAEAPHGDAGPVHRALRHEWRTLPPIPTVQSRPLVTLDPEFEQQLTTRRPPTFLAPLGHHLAPTAPAGRVAPAPAPRQPVTFPPVPSIQRQVITSAGDVEIPQLLMENEQNVRFSSRVGENDAATAAPSVVPAAAVTSAAVTSRLVTAARAPGLPTATFPTVSRLAADAPPAVEPTSEPSGEEPSEAAPTGVQPSGDEPATALLGDKPPMTSLPQPAGETLPAAGGSGRVEGATPAVAGRAVQRTAGPATPPSTPSRPTGGPGATAPRQPAPERPGRPAPPTVARTLDPTGTPKPRVTPRIGPPIQRTETGAPQVAPPATPPDPDPGPSASADAGPASVPPAVPSAPIDVESREVGAGESVTSLPLVGERGWIGPGPAEPTLSPPTSTPSAGPVAAQRAVTWRPRVGEPSAPVASTTDPPAASTPAPGRPTVSRPTVSRHAVAGAPGHEHPGDESPVVSPLPISRLPASTSVARAPRSDARTRSAATQETTAGIRWSEQPAPTTRHWTAAEVQRVTSTPPRTSIGGPTSRPTGRAISSPPIQGAAGPRPVAAWNVSFEEGRAPTWIGSPPSPALDVVQRQAEETPPAPEPAPEPTTVTATAEAGPAATPTATATAAGASAPAGGRAKAPTGAEADEWARALYPALRRRICRDLLLDRERSGYSTDIRF